MAGKRSGWWRRVHLKVWSAYTHLTANVLSNTAPTDVRVVLLYYGTNGEWFRLGAELDDRDLADVLVRLAVALNDNEPPQGA